MTDRPLPDPARWRSLAVCLAASSMTLLDLSIVNVALPTLQSSLAANDSDLQWIVAGYALAFGVALVPAGRLGDARSRRSVFVAGIVLFTLSSALAGTAPSATVLAVARVLQGFGGGMIVPQTSGFVQNLFSGPDRAQAFGLLGAAIGVSTAIGPLVGGCWSTWAARTSAGGWCSTSTCRSAWRCCRWPSASSPAPSPPASASRSTRSASYCSRAPCC